jgi:hypothetical protein
MRCQPGILGVCGALSYPSPLWGGWLAEGQSGGGFRAKSFERHNFSFASNWMFYFYTSRDFCGCTFDPRAAKGVL